VLQGGQLAGIVGLEDGLHVDQGQEDVPGLAILQEEVPEEGEETEGKKKKSEGISNSGRNSWAGLGLSLPLSPSFLGLTVPRPPRPARWA
jgi:hypothetical protein